MKFLIQNNLMNEVQLAKLSKAVSKYPHQFCGVVPFSREITSDTPIEGTDYIPYGSTLMTTILSDMGMKGMEFDLNLMNYECFRQNHPMMLNEGPILSLTNACDYLNHFDRDREFFVRPSKDLKQFSGTVETASEMFDWFHSMMAAGVGGGSYYMAPEEKVVLASVKEIKAEWRWFIIDGKIVSGSMYRAHGQMRQIEELDGNVIAEAQQLGDIWIPHKNVVMDTALVGDEIKVIEFNCIHSAGFYANNVEKIIDAWWNSYQ